MLVACAGIAGAKADDTIVLSSFEAPGLTPVAQSALVRAYKRLGLKVEFRVTEPARALVGSTSGATDGETARIREVGDRYPVLLRVNVPLLTVTTYGYTNRPELQRLAPHALKSLRAGHVRGAVFGEIAASGHREIWRADEPEQLFEMLKQGRLDVVFVRETRAREMIDRFGMDNVVAIPASRRDHAFYHYLHERHAVLVPRVEDALRDVLSVQARARAAPPG